MAFIKKNLVFSLFVLIALGVCAAGAYMAFSANGKLDSLQREVKTAEQQHRSLLQAAPSPSADNLVAAEDNVKQLTAELGKIREELRRGSRINASDDGVRVMAAIQQFIFDFQRKAAAHTTEKLEEAKALDPEATRPDMVGNDFAFGFEAYLKDATIPNDPTVVPELDKQRQILTYLMNQLIQADPMTIESVQRELIEQAAATDSRSSSKGFAIDPAITAAVPGAIDTMAFSVTFTGKTSALRDFLNELAQFNMPIVVRSVTVERPSGSATTVTAPRGGLESIFGAFEPAKNAGTGDAEPETQKPVVENTDSRFSVVLEFIDIVLPTETTEEAS
ncbi:Amuc_1100 family pilus-like protein [Coraliomargarita parva]|uniref:Amuc_1100 family pilus-like protein n=1 Tax=Coraliomargarita parva TaxID=3014050 RepID=UPI0022B38184|nr:Amuc_1100 family pilus-like protein [Coraliomargarita parva]